MRRVSMCRFSIMSHAERDHVDTVRAISQERWSVKFCFIAIIINFLSSLILQNLQLFTRPPPSPHLSFVVFVAVRCCHKYYEAISPCAFFFCSLSHESIRRGPSCVVHVRVRWIMKQQNNPACTETECHNGLHDVEVSRTLQRGFKKKKKKKIMLRWFYF